MPPFAHSPRRNSLLVLLRTEAWHSWAILRFKHQGEGLWKLTRRQQACLIIVATLVDRGACRRAASKEDICRGPMAADLPLAWRRERIGSAGRGWC